MQQFDDFVKAVSDLGTAKDNVKAAAAALHAAIDSKVDEVGKQVAAETTKAQ